MKVPTITTTAELKTARMLLGLTREEAGMIFDVPATAVRDAEKHNTRFIDKGWAETYRQLEAEVQAFINACFSRKPTHIVVYRNEIDFRASGDPWAERLLFPQVHLMAAARARDELWNDSEGGRYWTVQLVLFNPSNFERWLGEPTGLDLKDTPRARELWAADYAKTYVLVEGGADGRHRSNAAA